MEATRNDPKGEYLNVRITTSSVVHVGEARPLTPFYGGRYEVWLLPLCSVGASRMLRSVQPTNDAPTCAKCAARLAAVVKQTVARAVRETRRAASDAKAYADAARYREEAMARADAAAAAARVGGVR